MIYKYILFLLYSLVLMTNVIFGQSGILILSPEPRSEISGENVLIAVSLIGANDLDHNSITLLLDGSDITDQAYVDSDMLSCLLDQVDPGQHKVNLIVDGMSQPVIWDFITTSKDPTVNYSGKIRSSNSMDQVDNQTLNINKLTLDFKGTAFEWLSLRTNLKMTSQENQLYQPRNIYGFSMGVKDILSINMGDSNPRMSHYTMNGNRIRGVDLNLKFGLLNFHFVQGEINRAIQGDPSRAYSYDINTDMVGDKYIALSRAGYTFQQNVTSARLAIGRGEIFQWGLSLMKARDDTNSVDQELSNAEIIYSPDITGSIDGLDSGMVYTIDELGTRAQILDGKDWSGNGPKDNLVISSDLGLNLFSKRLRIDGEVAFSMTNNNIWGGPLTLAELDTLIDDSVDNKLSSFDLSSFPDPADYEQYLIINSNLAPLVPIDINAFGDNSTIDLVDAIFSMPSLAYRGRAITNFYGNYLALEYSQVGSEFNSLANPYIVKNKREWSITDKFKLFNNRLMLNIGYKHQDDDILTSVENVKTQNTLSFGFNAVPGPGLPTINFNYRSINRDNGIDQIVQLTDTTYTDNREKTHTNNIMVNLNHRFDLLWDHSLSGTFVNVEKEDKYTDRSQLFVDPSISTQVINVSLSTRYNSPLETRINITTNSSELSTGPGQRGSQDFLNMGIDANYPFLKKRLLVSSGLSFANGTGMVDMSWLGFKAGLRWSILEDLSLNTQGEFRSKETNGSSKNTIIARMNLEYSF